MASGSPSFLSAVLVADLIPLHFLIYLLSYGLARHYSGGRPAIHFQVVSFYLLLHAWRLYFILAHVDRLVTTNPSIRPVGARKIGANKSGTMGLGFI